MCLKNVPPTPVSGILKIGQNLNYFKKSFLIDVITKTDEIRSVDFDFFILPIEQKKAFKNLRRL